MSALTYRDGSFIKVKNITLGYTLPQSVSRKVLMEKCRFYATAYNPFLYVKDKELRGTILKRMVRMPSRCISSLYLV